MIASMTGYALAAQDLPGGRVALELRTVNHRYLEFQCRLPDELRALEASLREAVAAKLTRGKVDCRVSFQAIQQADSTPNPDALAGLKAAAAQISASFPEARALSVWEVLHAPGVLAAASLDAELLRAPTAQLMQQALADLNATRGREGEKLAAMIGERLSGIEALCNQAAPLVPGLVRALEEKLTQRLAEASAAPIEDRIRQEVVLFAAKVDVAEELSRLGAHVSEARRILKQGGAAGKRLDFLMQEFNREANTLGSKSVSTEITRIAVEMKVLIEQMREQVQNIE